MKKVAIKDTISIRCRNLNRRNIVLKLKLAVFNQLKVTANRDHLIDLKNNLYIQFFAQTNPGLNNWNLVNVEIASKYQAEEKAKEPLAQKLGNSFEQTDSFISTDSMNKLNHSLSEIAWMTNDYNALFTAMQNNVVAKTTLDQYKNDFALISCCGKRFKVCS